MRTYMAKQSQLFIKVDSAYFQFDATKTVLSGMPDDWKARPETSSIAIAPQFRDELPAYSLTVVRLKSKP